MKHSEKLNNWICFIHNLITAKKRNGLLLKKPCEKCGKKEHIHAHHNSYLFNDFLKITWLCGKHHAEWHKSKKAKYPNDIDLKDYFNRYKQKELNKLYKNKLNYLKNYLYLQIDFDLQLLKDIRNNLIIKKFNFPEINWVAAEICLKSKIIKRYGENTLNEFLNRYGIQK